MPIFLQFKGDCLDLHIVERKIWRSRRQIVTDTPEEKTGKESRPAHLDPQVELPQCQSVAHKRQSSVITRMVWLLLLMAEIRLTS